MIFSGIVAAVSAVATFIGGLGAIGTFALQMAASVGLSYLAKAIAGKKSATSSAASSVSGVQGTLQSGGDVARSFVLGKGATAGSLVYANTWGNSGGTPNAYLTQVIAISDLPIKGLLDVWVNNEKCTRGDASHPEYGYPVLEYRASGVDYLWIKFYNGTQTTSDSFLTSKVSSDDRPYESTRVGTGVAYAIVTSLVNDTLFTGFPQLIFCPDGISLYDPSRDDSVGGIGDQRYSDPATWGGDGDDLPAVQTYNLLRGIIYGGQWLYGLQGVTAARLPAANWIAQIEKCRAQVDISDDETEPAYRSGGQIDVSVQLGDTVEALLTACQGKLAETGGFYKIHLGAPDSPTFFFTDNEIISTSEQSFTPFFGLSDTITGVAAKYPEPTEAWAMKPAPPLYRTDLDAKAGNRRLMADVSLDFVPYPTQAQRVMQSALLAAQRARRHTHTFPPSFWFVEPGDVGEWTSARNGYASKLFEVNGAVDKSNLDVTVDLTEVDPDDFEWDYATDFTPITSGPTIFPRPAAQPIVDWYAEADTIKDSNGINRRPAIRLTWDGEMPGVSGVQFEVRLKSDASEVARGRTDQLDTGAVLVSQGILPATEYQARGRYIPTSPRETIWSDWLDVTTLDIRVDTVDLNNKLTALFQRVNERIPDDLLTMRADLDSLSASVNSQVTSIKENNGQVNIATGSKLQENEAATELAMRSATTANSALAAILGEVYAVTETGEAEGLIRFVASSAPDGVAASFSIEVRADTLNAFAFSGLYLDAGVVALGGGSRIRLVADAVMMENPSTGAIFNALLSTISDTPPTVPIVSGALTVDLSNRQVTHKSLITAAAQIKFPTGAKPGLSWTHALEQDGTGGHAISFDTTFMLTPTPIVSQIANTITVLRGEVVDTSVGPRAIMTALGGGTTNPAALVFQNMIVGLGLHTNLLASVDAGSSASWDSAVSTAYLRDLTGNGRHLERGASPHAPTFNGTIGQLTSAEYFSTDTNDYFDWVSSAEWQSFHKAGARFTLAYIMRVPFVASTMGLPLFDTSVDQSSNVFKRGVWANLSRTAAGQLQLGLLNIDDNSGAMAFNQSSTLRSGLTDKFIFVAMSVNAASPTNGLILRLQATNEIYNASYAVTNNNISWLNRPRMFQSGTLGTMPDVRLAAAAIWDRALSASELDQLYTRVAQSGRWPDIT